MSDNLNKGKILKKEGFGYHLRLGLYINEESRKIFSLQALDEFGTDWLVEKINEPSLEDDWQLYFIDEVTDSHKKAILENMHQ